MRKVSLTLIFCFFYLISTAQQEFHVFPNGQPTGNGSLQEPWDLQTALSQKPEVVNGGDTIWLHGGTYTGRYVSTIKSTIDTMYITVAPYQSEKVILNGNVDSDLSGVLNVTGARVIFRDLEITWLGAFSRDKNDPDFENSAGVYHTAGEDCRFYDLIIHNNPGLGFGSWKQTGGTIIENCMIYHNGFKFENGKGGGEGMYVQNTKDDTRIIRNNIIFGNFYKGIEVWSAGRNSDYEYVKNITLDGNILFNSGAPSGSHYDNVIVATDDRNGINIAKNINVLNNVFYHNTDYLKNEVNGDAPSLTIGFIDNAPVEDITVENNIILGRNNALRLLHIKSMAFVNNTVYTGYVVLNSNEMPYASDWSFRNNRYYTKKNGAFRIIQDKNYPLKDWQATFGLDVGSQWQPTKDFDLKPVLRIARHALKPNTFNLALFSKEGGDVEVDFKEYQISNGSSYKIYDVENRNEVLVSGIVTSSKKVMVPMNSTKFEAPLNDAKAEKTQANFGVFIIEFDTEKTTSNTDSSRLQKLLQWLGF